MKKHEEYNLEFKIAKNSGRRDSPVCNVTFNDGLFHWENYLTIFLEESMYGGAESFIEFMQAIINDKWEGIIGFESLEDNVVILDKTLTSVRFDLNDGFAYFDEGTFTDPLLVVKISFIDLIKILEEWNEFLGSFMGGYYQRNYFD